MTLQKYNRIFIYRNFSVINYSNLILKKVKMKETGIVKILLTILYGGRLINSSSLFTASSSGIFLRINLLPLYKLILPRPAPTYP